MGDPSADFELRRLENSLDLYRQALAQARLRYPPSGPGIGVAIERAVADQNIRHVQGFIVEIERAIRRIDGTLI